MAKEKIIGIDLGTSNSQAAVMLGGKPTTIPSAEGATMYGKAFPSVVAFTKEEQLLVGDPARRQAVTNPDGTITAAKRKMGSGHKYKVHGKEYTPQQVSAFILQKIKKDAEAFLGEPVKKAVITVPAYFNDNQRQATKDSGEIAGLDVVRIINEPTAAALAYGLDKEGEHKILVFDLGGGTLDVTVLEFGDGIFEVKSTAGDTELGGTDMDAAVIEWIINEFKSQEGVDISKDKMATQRVREAAEKAKIELSTVLTTDINMPYITSDASGPKHLSLTLTRAKLESLVAPVVVRCKHPMEQAMKDAKTAKEDIKKVILVGGPTRMPTVRTFVEEFVGKGKIEGGVDPMECVSFGASIQGAVLSGDVKDILLLDVTPLTLGIETLGGVATALIPRNTTIPAKKSQIFSTASDSQNAVTINVVQGERPMSTDNTSLGTFNLVGIPPAPRGVPQIEVEFDIDANGILNVSAKDKGTGTEQKITISASTKMPKEDIENLVKEAEKFAEDDKKKKEEVEIKNSAESMAYTAEKTLSDLGDKIPADKKEKIESSMKSLKDVMGGEDTTKMKAETEALGKVLQEVGASMYQQSAAPKETTTDSGEKDKESKDEKKPEEKVVDAEYKVDDEKKE